MMLREVSRWGFYVTYVMITNIKISILVIITFVVDFFELSLNVLCLLYAVHFCYLYIVLEGNFAEGASAVVDALAVGVLVAI